jgi:hypothetical protein
MTLLGANVLGPGVVHPLLPPPSPAPAESLPSLFVDLELDESYSSDSTVLDVPSRPRILSSSPNFAVKTLLIHKFWL